MKDLIGYLKKTPYLFSIVLSFFLLSSFKVYSQEQFNVSTSFVHTLSESGLHTQAILTVESEIPRVFSYYTISIPAKNLQVSCSNHTTNTPLKCDSYHRGSLTDVLINFENTVVRPDLPLEISLEYSTEQNISAKTFVLPSKIVDATTESVFVKYPKSLGEPTSSSDPIQKVEADGEFLKLTVQKPSYKSISLFFGDSVIYEFEIKKVFSNTLGDENQTFELYVPSDTSSQTIIWESIDPMPNISIKDVDGNYIFKYIVAPDETVSCNISGYIQKKESPEEESPTESFLTNQTGYWSLTNRTEMKRVISFLEKKGLTEESLVYDKSSLKDQEKQLLYKHLYEYTINRLDYSEDVQLGLLNETRLGANSLTESSLNATTIDYADFYISLLREFGIPSRLVIGFVSNISGYTTDGFYHHWVEYFDEVDMKWVVADPFLQEYFEKDLFGSGFEDHITILRRGQSSVAPKVSFFTDNDFKLTPSQEDSVEVVFDINTQLSFGDSKITDKYLNGYIYLSNKGNVAINGYALKNSNIDDIGKYLDPVNNIRSQIVLPKQSTTLQLNIPYEVLGSSNVFINMDYFNSPHFQESILLEADIETTTPFYISVFAKLVSLLLFASLLYLLYLGIMLLRRRNG